MASFFHLSDQVARAISITLAGSLVLGLLLSAIVGIVITFTRRASSAWRYRLLVVALFGFCAGTIAILINTCASETGFADAQASGTAFHALNVLPEELISEHQLLSFLGAHAHQIVCLWLVFVLLRTFGLIKGLYGLRQLRKSASFTVPNHLQQRLKTLAGQMGFCRAIELAESARVSAPVVIGHLKPLVLIPMGMLLALPPQAIEAILIHELAHITRRDYLLNLLISAIEVIFFFNPGVLWVIMLIRLERENCCDDVVLKHTDNKIEYIKALVSCQEYQLSANAYAMHLNGHKNHLLVRVKRMLADSNKSLNIKEKSLIGISAVLVLAVALVVSKSGDHPIKHQVSAVVARDEIADHIAPEKIFADGHGPGTNQVTRRFEKAVHEEHQDDDVAEQAAADLLEAISDADHLAPLSTLSHEASLNSHLSKLDSLHAAKAAERKLRREIYRDDRKLDREAKKAATIDSASQYTPKYKISAGDQNAYRPKTATPRRHPIERPIDPKMAVKGSITAHLAEAILRDSLVSMVKSYKLSESELIVNGKRIDKVAFESFKSRNMPLMKGTTIYYNYDTSTIIN